MNQASHTLSEQPKKQFYKNNLHYITNNIFNDEDYGFNNYGHFLRNNQFRTPFRMQVGSRALQLPSSSRKVNQSDFLEHLASRLHSHSPDIFQEKRDSLYNDAEPKKLNFANNASYESNRAVSTLPQIQDTASPVPASRYQFRNILSPQKLKRTTPSPQNLNLIRKSLPVGSASPYHTVDPKLQKLKKESIKKIEKANKSQLIPMPSPSHSPMPPSLVNITISPTLQADRSADSLVKVTEDSKSVLTDRDYSPKPDLRQNEYFSQRKKSTFENYKTEQKEAFHLPDIKRTEIRGVMRSMMQNNNKNDGAKLKIRQMMENKKRPEVEIREMKQESQRTYRSALDDQIRSKMYIDNVLGTLQLQRGTPFTTRDKK